MGFDIKMSFLPPPERRDQVVYWAVFGVAVIVLAYFVAGHLTAVYNDAIDEQISALDVGQRAPRHATNGVGIEGWKTYRNEKYGFEMRYPQSWSLRKEGEGRTLERFYIESPKGSAIIISPTRWPTSLPAIARSSSGEDFFAGYSVKVTNYLTEGGEKLSRFIDFLKYPASWRNGYIFVMTSDAGLRRECGGKDIEVYGCDVGWRYSGSINQEETKAIDQILSTFKFIELVDTSTWKTYQSKKMGFEVQYPGNWTSSFLELRDFGEQSRRIDFNTPSPATVEDIFIHLAFIKNQAIYSSDKGRNLTFREEIEGERVAGKNEYKLFPELRKPGVGEFEEKQISLGSYPATKISYTVFHARSGEYRRTTSIFEEKHNFQIYIGVSPYSKLKEKDYLSTINTILSTFKFIEP